jgi:hypothetical protein
MFRGSRYLGKILGYSFSPIKFHLSLLGSLASLITWRHLAATVGASRKRGGGETGGTKSLMAAVQPRPWLRALVNNNNKNNVLCHVCVIDKYDCTLISWNNTWTETKKKAVAQRRQTQASLTYFRSLDLAKLKSSPISSSSLLTLTTRLMDISARLHHSV